MFNSNERLTEVTDSTILRKRGERVSWVCLVVVAWLPIVPFLYVTGYFDKWLVKVTRNDFARPSGLHKRIAVGLGGAHMLAVAGVVV